VAVCHELYIKVVRFHKRRIISLADETLLVFPEGFLSVENGTFMNDKCKIIHNMSIVLRSSDSAVDIATDYGLDEGGVGVRVPVESIIFSSPRHPDRLWDPPNLLSSGYRGLFSTG
jgi:hypothetical protein